MHNPTRQGTLATPDSTYEWRSFGEHVTPALIEAWPRDTRFAQRAFELLRRAYVDTRYSPHYKISDEELAWLIERVEILQNLVREVCEARLSAGS